MTGAELLVRCLEREGVRYVFGVPGEETLDVNEALAHSSIRFVPVRHEQAAAFMADVWGRLTGHAGVVPGHPRAGRHEPRHRRGRREPGPRPGRGDHGPARPAP